MTDEQKRSSIDGTDGAATVAEGVGGRRQGSPPAAWGGGYLDECNKSIAPLGAIQKKSRAAADQRINELRRIGIPAKWLAVAEVIGYDSFIAMSVVLNDGVAPPVRIYTPPILKITRYNRNQVIRAMASDGANLYAIKEAVRQRFSDDLSLRHISRVLARETAHRTERDMVPL